MEATFNIGFDGQILQVSFGAPSDNDQKVIDAAAGCEAVKPQVMEAGLKILKVNGAASLPVAFTICHAFAHVVPAIAVFDPKMVSYVVSVSHSPDFKVGDVLK